MKRRMGFAILLTIILGTFAMPLAGATDSGKLFVKEMVQSPVEYSVGVFVRPTEYLIPAYVIIPHQMI